MERIRGNTITIWDETFTECLRIYQDPEGWAVSDTGLNEDENGYHFSVRARGIGGERNISLSLTREALKGMLKAVEERYPLQTGSITTTNSASSEDVAWNVFNQTITGCCGGGCCV